MFRNNFRNKIPIRKGSVWRCSLWLVRLLKIENGIQNMAFWQAEMFSVELIFTLPRDQILSPTTHTHSELESQISFENYEGKRNTSLLHFVAFSM